MKLKNLFYLKLKQKSEDEKKIRDENLKKILELNESYVKTAYYNNLKNLFN